MNECIFRILGGLLSAHQMALRIHLHIKPSLLNETDCTSLLYPINETSEDTDNNHCSCNSSSHSRCSDSRGSVSTRMIYDGKTLLRLAVEVGNRLLPAFKTKTGTKMITELIYVCCFVL